MDYNRNECQAVVETSEENLFNLRPSTGVAFFEAICLRGNSAKCQKRGKMPILESGLPPSVVQKKQQRDKGGGQCIKQGHLAAAVALPSGTNDNL